MTTFTKRIVASGDDGYRNNTSFDNSSASIAFGNLSGGILDCFLRFTNVTIPQGATINSAKVTFQAQSSLSGATCTVKISCNAEDNATAPTTAADLNSKVRTTASSSWNAAGQTAGSNYDTPDFTSAVQEVISRSGWASGNALMVLIDNNASSTSAYRLEDTYDGDAANCALLTIDYIDPTGGANQFSLWAL